MYKTVKFNVFKENIEETVYQKETVTAETEIISSEKMVETKTEIIAKPRNYYRFDGEREGTSLVL